MDLIAPFSRLLDRIAENGGRRVTDVPLAALLHSMQAIAGSETERLSALGIVIEGDSNITVAVSDGHQPFGSIHIANAAPGGFVMLGHYAAGAPSHLGLRIVGPNTIVAFPDMAAPSQTFYLPNVLLRSANQILYWGAGSTAVMAQLELDGDGRAMLIGDDAMLSNDVWIRNHDMHTIFDTATGEIRNTDRGDVVLEQHVWLGQGALVLGPRRVGFGSIVSARSFVNSDVEPESLVVGTPARKLRDGLSWDRAPGSVDQATLARLSALH